MNTLIRIFCAFLIFCPFGVVAEEPVKQCASLVSECYAKSGLQQSNCLFTTSKHPFCAGSALGKLVYKRWSMSSVRPIGVDAPPAFLGPKIINQECVTNFDNMIVVVLLEKNIQQKAIQNLEAELQSCTKDISNKLTRP